MPLRTGLRPRPATLVLGGLIAAALLLRLVGIRHGLPFAFNPDEGLHFVPRAVDAAEGDWDPGYYDNPAGLTYVLAMVYRLSALAGVDVTSGFESDPTAAFTVARVVVALLGTSLVPLVHWAGRRYFDEAVGLVAAALVTFGFLPAYYSHQAVNDVPTLLPLTIALGGCLLVVERGTWWTYVMTGTALGVAGAVKYLAAPMAVVVVLAVAIRVARHAERPVRAGLLLVAAGAACVAALLALNPFLLLDFGTAREQLTGQSSLASTAKLGQEGTGWTYYPASLLWGLGAVPVVLVGVGAAAALRERRPQAVLLLAFPVLLYLFLSTQDRFFARWLLPAYPALAILAGYGATWLAARWRDRADGRLDAGLALPVIAVLALAQPVVDAVRSDLVLIRTDTRTEAIGWIQQHVGGTRRIVVEPAVPGRYLSSASGYTRYPVAPPYQGYEETLAPALLDDYRSRGYCWVMVNSHQRDRGLAGGLDDAAAYYERLAAESTVEATFSPYRAGAPPPAFSYDLSFNWYPTEFEQPGPLIEVRRLTDCAG